MEAEGSFATDLDRAEPKEIKKEGLSEYFLYTIEGTETIPNGWSKRLISFEVPGVPVVNLYKYEQQRYCNNVMRFLSFANDEKHELGETPIPGGLLKVYRNAGDNGHLGVLTVIHKGLVGGALLREAVIAECLDTSCELGDGIHGHRAPRIISGIDRDSSPTGLRGEP